MSLTDAMLAAVDRRFEALFQRFITWGTVVEAGDPLMVRVKGQAPAIPVQAVDGYVPEPSARCVLIKVGLMRWQALPGRSL